MWSSEGLGYLSKASEQGGIPFESRLKFADEFCQAFLKSCKNINQLQYAGKEDFIIGKEACSFLHESELPGTFSSGSALVGSNLGGNQGSGSPWDQAGIFSMSQPCFINITPVGVLQVPPKGRILVSTCKVCSSS